MKGHAKHPQGVCVFGLGVLPDIAMVFMEQRPLEGLQIFADLNIDLNEARSLIVCLVRILAATKQRLGPGNGIRGMRSCQLHVLGPEKVTHSHRRIVVECFQNGAGHRAWG